MLDITSTLPVGVNLPLGFNAKWPPHVNHQRVPGVLWLGFNDYGYNKAILDYITSFAMTHM